MRLKYGVDISGLKIEMRVVLKEADMIWKMFGRKEGVTVTSGLESTRVHSAGSYHPYGYAVDFRIKYFGAERKKAVMRVLCVYLKAHSGFYDIVLERDHIHVEFDYSRSIEGE